MKGGYMAKTNSRRTIYLGTIVLGLVTASLYSEPSQQRTFMSPQDAIQATIEASERNDTAALREIFGADSKNIIESGDPSQDKTDRAGFASMARQKMEINQDSSNADRATFTIGDEDWPFPVPLVRNDGKWRFDTAAGKMEILAHRIGENELDAIDMSRAFAEAELEYAKTPRDGVLEYAQKMKGSSPKHDGLYGEGDTQNPISNDFANAVASGKPFHGYYFKILTAQGASAPGGALNYVVNGRMIGGFALVAWPAEYEASGVKTFVVSHHGVVFEKDLGSKTSVLVSQMSRFDPDSSWREVRGE
jgi:hypothetical protein